MKIMGIDPGTARLGWAIIAINGSTITPIDYGCIMTNIKDSPPVRLSLIFHQISDLLKFHHPDAMSVEGLFHATNAKTVIPVAQARGVVLLAAAEHSIEVATYSPLAVKRTITGDGKADKKQIEWMIMKTLRLSVVPKSDDTADALAIALTHAYSYKMKARTL